MMKPSRFPVHLLSVVFLPVVLGLASAVQAGDAVYLFASFRGNGEDGLHLAHSRDGLEWTALNGDKSFLKPEVGGKLMRDPCIIQGPDGMFHMVWTTSWSDNGIGYARSKDLIKWSEQQFVPVMEHEPAARNCWAPEITWDPDGNQYVIYWATTIAGRFPVTAKAADPGWSHRMYCTTTRDFKSYTPTRLFYDPGINVIDSTILRDGASWVMITKDETRHPPAKNLHLARSDHATGPWHKTSEPFTRQGLWVEGPTAIKIGGFWHVYFDCYTEHRYGVMRTKDFKNWEDVSDQLVVPKGLRHGTVFAAGEEVFARLLSLEPVVPDALPNPSFEDQEDRDGTASPRGWKPVVYDGKADFAPAGNGRNGSRCVRIASPGGADASWQTTVGVKPHSRYKLSGWIRTDGLAGGSGRGALLNIHELASAATEAVTGTTGWRQVEVVFDTGRLTGVTVNALFGGWGLSSGSAWYDDLRLERLGDVPDAPT